MLLVDTFIYSHMLDFPIKTVVYKLTLNDTAGSNGNESSTGHVL